MTIKHVAFDGKSNFFLDQYPESAWVQLSPTTSDMADSRAATQAATNYYQSVAFLFRCVQIRQAALLNVPWAVVRNDKDIWTSEDSKPPADLAFMANFRRLLRNTEAALCLAPEAFWFRERNRARTLSLKWHAPSSVMPQYSESEGLTGFKRILGGGKERTFGPDDYIYFALPNPMHETIPGRPPAQAAMAAAGVLYNVDAFASAFFSRGAIKATLLTVEGNPQNSEMLKLESWWKRFFSGVKSAWETAAVRAGVKPVIIGEGMESLNQSTLTRERKEDIAAALGIPHSIVMSDAANRSVAETDDLHFYDKTIIPEMEFLAETLNDQLFGPLGYEFVLRPQSMTVFQENEEERSMSLLHYTQAGFPAHIAAEILGIDLPEGMDYAELAELISGQQAQRDAVAISAMQARQTQTPRTVEAPETVQETQQGTPPAESQSNTRSARLDEIRRFKAWAKKRNNPDPSKFRSDILSEDEKRAILADEVSADTDFFTVALPSVWSGQNIPSPSDSIEAFKALVLQMDDDDDEAEQRARDAIERAAAEELAAALERQRRALLPSNVTPTSATDVVRRVDETSGTVRDALRRMLILSADLGVSVAIAQFETIGFGFDWTLVNTDARDWANRYTGELITMINDTTRRQVQQAVVQWIENGDPLSALIRELAPTFGRDRAGLIASTEVTRAYAEANLLAYRQSGVVSQVQWMTSNDERVCPICAPLGGLTFGDSRSEPASIDDQNRRGVLASLAGGFIHPGGNGAAARFAGGNYRIPPAHPRCRCWIVPVIEEPEAFVPAETVAETPTSAQVVPSNLSAGQHRMIERFTGDEYRVFEREGQVGAFKDMYKEWAETLTSAERDALMRYQEVTFGDINLHLRRGLSTSHANSLPDIEQLDSLIGRSYVPHNVKAYRGLKLDRALSVGEEFSDNGFVSTSLSNQAAGNYATARGGNAIFEIRIPQGQRGAMVDAVISKDEYELLLPRGTSFKVTGTRTTTVRGVDMTVYEADLVLAVPAKSFVRPVKPESIENDRFVWSESDLVFGRIYNG